MAKKHVFISYCRDNALDVGQLRDELIAAGEGVWWDQDIKGGQDWRYEIRKAIRDAYAIVLCLSKESEMRVTSGIYPEAADSIAAYREYAPGSIFLIPVRLSDCDIPAIEIDSTRTLDRLQYIDIYPRSRRRVGLERLCQAIREAPHHPTARLRNSSNTTARSRVSTADSVLNRKSRTRIRIRWVAVPFCIVALSSMGWYLYVRHRGGYTAFVSSKPAATGQGPDTVPGTSPGVAPASPLISRRKPGASHLAEPTWADIRLRVQKEYAGIVKLEKSGTFLCTKAPDPTIQIWDWPWEQYNNASEGSVCRQDVDVIEQGADEVRNVFKVAVLYARNKGHWQFSKLASRRVGSEHQ